MKNSLQRNAFLGFDRPWASGISEPCSSSYRDHQHGLSQTHSFRCSGYKLSKEMPNGSDETLHRANVLGQCPTKKSKMEFQSFFQRL